MSDRAARLRLEVRPRSLSSYQLALRVDGQVALELDVSTWHSMNDVRAKLREDLQRLRDLIGEQLAISDWTTVTKGMRHLAEVGDVLLLQLLGSRARDRGVLQDQCRRAWPGWVVASTDAPVLEVDAPPEALFPFELLPLFDASPVQDIHDVDALRRVARRFAGFAMVVQRTLLTQVDQDGVLHGDPAMPVKMFHHAGLDAGATEHQVLRNATNAVALAGPWPEQDLEETHLVDTLARYLSDPVLGFDGRRAKLADQIHHFSCHCDTGWPSPTDYAIELAGRGGETRRVTLGKLMAALSRLFASPNAEVAMPLVVLNACASSATAPNGDMSFPEFFCMINRNRGFLGTEARVPDEVAAAVATQFYAEVLRGVPVGQALLTAKLGLLEDYRNPLGALYVFYGNPALRWEPAQEGEAR